jgi:methionyl-tRNA synthetase
MTAPHTYITTTIPYVNARPHMGHALELVQADVLARFRRGRGDSVRFQAGTDCLTAAGRKTSKSSGAGAPGSGRAGR